MEHPNSGRSQKELKKAQKALKKAAKQMLREQKQQEKKARKLAKREAKKAGGSGQDLSATATASASYSSYSTGRRDAATVIRGQNTPTESSRGPSPYLTAVRSWVLHRQACVLSREEVCACLNPGAWQLCVVPKST